MKNKLSKRSELLLPAGSMKSIKTAILYGADAVYCGTPDLSLRTKSSFSLDEMIEAVKYVHNKGKRIYLTLNLFSHNKDIEKIKIYLANIKKISPDALIISDPGIFSYVKKELPEIEIHISTQANICSYLSVDFWKEQGASLIVLARELSFDEIKEIKEKSKNIKIETFIHGAICMTYSGRCLLSNFLAERGANQGSCAHSCRWNYKLKIKLKDNTEHEIEINDNNKDLFDFFLEEEIRPGEFLPFEEDMHGSYILNAKDLCLMPYLDQYLDINIDSLKIEGRNKSEYYIGSTSRIYKMAIDDYYEDKNLFNNHKDYYMEEINKISNRGYSVAFHNNRLSNLSHDYDSTKSSSNYIYIGRINYIDENYLLIEVKNRIEKFDILEFLSPIFLKDRIKYQKYKEPILFRIYEMIDQNNKENEVFHPGNNKINLKIRLELFNNELNYLSNNSKLLTEILPEGTLIRKKNTNISSLENIRKKIHNESIKLEDNDNQNNNRYDILKKKYHKLNDSKELQINKAKLPEESCCKKGCNGCLIFWHDDKYKELRDELKKKNIGEML